MSTPNKANIRKWVDALRSGDYEQASGRLRQGDTYCCLGVACEIAGVPGRLTPDGLTYEYADCSGFLPDETSKWLGLPGGRVNVYELGPEGESASDLNDMGFSFDEIADLLEAKFLPEEAA